MALGRAFSVAVCGLDGEIVEIEADITSGLPGEIHEQCAIKSSSVHACLIVLI